MVWIGTYRHAIDIAIEEHSTSIDPLVTCVPITLWYVIQTSQPHTSLHVFVFIHDIPNMPTNEIKPKKNCQWFVQQWHSIGWYSTLLHGSPNLGFLPAGTEHFFPLLFTYLLFIIHYSIFDLHFSRNCRLSCAQLSHRVCNSIPWSMYPSIMPSIWLIISTDRPFDISSIVWITHFLYQWHLSALLENIHDQNWHSAILISIEQFNILPLLSHTHSHFAYFLIITFYFKLNHPLFRGKIPKPITKTVWEYKNQLRS